MLTDLEPGQTATVLQLPASAQLSEKRPAAETATESAPAAAI